MSEASNSRSVLSTAINAFVVFGAASCLYGCLYLLLLKPVSVMRPPVSYCPTHTIFRPVYTGVTANESLHRMVLSIFEPAYQVDRRIRPEFWRRPIVWIPVVDGRDVLSPQTVKMLESYVARQNSRTVETTNNDL